MMLAREGQNKAAAIKRVTEGRKLPSGGFPWPRVSVRGCGRVWKCGSLCMFVCIWLCIYIHGQIDTHIYIYIYVSIYIYIMTEGDEQNSAENPHGFFLFCSANVVV